MQFPSDSDALLKTHFLTNDESSGAEAEACLWEAVDLVESSMEESPERFDLKREFIEIHLQGASLWFAGLKSFLDEREPTFGGEGLKPLLRLSEELLAADPGDAETRHLHARLLDTVASFHKEQRDRWFHQSIELLEKLVREDPRVAAYRRSLASAIWSKLINTDRETSAAAEWKRVVAILQRLAQEYPHTPEHRANLANGHHHLAMSLQTVDQAATVQEYAKAEQLLLGLIDEYPDCRDYYNRMTWVYGAWGQYLRQDVSDPELLVDVLERNVELYSRMKRDTECQLGNEQAAQARLSRANQWMNKENSEALLNRFTHILTPVQFENGTFNDDVRSTGLGIDNFDLIMGK